jgi:hypothetical protein
MQFYTMSAFIEFQRARGLLVLGLASETSVEGHEEFELGDGRCGARFMRTGASF